MHNSKKIAAVISYSQIAINLLYNVFITPFLLRSLGQNEHGIYSLCSSVLSYLGLFQFGFGTTFIRYYIKYDAEKKWRERDELNGMFLEIFGVVAFITAAVGIALICNAEFVFGGKITQEEYTLAKSLLSLVVLNATLSVIGVPFNALITAHEKFVFQQSLSLFDALIKFVLIVPILKLGYKSFALVLMNTILTVFTLTVNAIYSHKKLHVRFRFTHFDNFLFKEISVFSFFVFLQSVMDIFNWQIDRFLLARYRGSAEISVYSIGSQICMVFLSLGAAVTGLYVPQANQMVSTKRTDGDLTALMIRVGRFQFMLTTFLFSAFVFFGKPFIALYAGTGYENSYWITLLLLAPLVLPLSMDLWYHIARAKALHKTSTTIFVAVASLNLLISIPLCKTYGEIGAAIGTCIGMFVANNIFQIWYAHNVVQLNMKEWAWNLIEMSKALIIPIGAGMLIQHYICMSSILSFLIYAAVYTIFSAISYWFFAMNPQERGLIKGSVLGFVRKISRGVHL